MKRILALGAVSALMSTVLTGCGGGGGDSAQYCKDLKADMGNLGIGDSSAQPDLDKAFSTVHTLAGEAPDAVKSDWKTIDDAFTKLESALKDAGLSASDFSKMSSGGSLPDGVDPAKLQQAMSSIQTTFDSDALKKAGDNVEKHAKDECGIDMSNNSSSSN